MRDRIHSAGRACVVVIAYLSRSFAALGRRGGDLYVYAVLLAYVMPSSIKTLPGPRARESAPRRMARPHVRGSRRRLSRFSLFVISSF